MNTAVHQSSQAAPLPLNETIRISEQGSVRTAMAHVVSGARILVSGRMPRVAQIFDEDWLTESPIGNPEEFIAQVRRAAIPADVVTFSGQFSQTAPRWGYRHDFRSLAVAPTTDYKLWWNSLPKQTRRHVRKSQQCGLVVRETVLDDAMVESIKLIYDETPWRQGRKFWHYGKPIAAVRAENSTYLDRSILVGAYVGEELAGFLKMVRIGKTARIMQIISKTSHRDKKTTSALIAKSVEVCSAKDIDYLVYGHYVYGRRQDSSLTEFKRRNGFKEVLLPKYFVPINNWGRFCLAIGAHRGIRQFLPLQVERALLTLRARTLSLWASFSRLWQRMN